MTPTGLWLGLVVGAVFCAFRYALPRDSWSMIFGLTAMAVFLASAAYVVLASQFIGYTRIFFPF